jgi:hypothetical protein
MRAAVAAAAVEVDRRAGIERAGIAMRDWWERSLLVVAGWNLGHATVAVLGATPEEGQTVVARGIPPSTVAAVVDGAGDSGVQPGEGRFGIA